MCLCPSRRVHQRGVQSVPTPAWAPATASVIKERHLAVAAALWMHFFPFLQSLLRSPAPPAQLADAAAGRYPPLGGKHDGGGDADGRKEQKV